MAVFVLSHECIKIRESAYDKDCGKLTELRRTPISGAASFVKAWRRIRCVSLTRSTEELLSWFPSPFAPAWVRFRERFSRDSEDSAISAVIRKIDFQAPCQEPREVVSKWSPILLRYLRVSYYVAKFNKVPNSMADNPSLPDSGFLKLQRFLDKQTCQDAARQRNNKRYVNEDIHPPINRIDKLHPDEE
ncbi:hypothetical protein EAG_12418 [Camponotus floridanus]|uniref:Uncharacterized protein n=1 Tax=Camponotus floridanus TaxID=104421 RepID=E2AWF5_CAMFO|nr:hypothetical protein EAG_12418 [Camponotus floridanus]